MSRYCHIKLRPDARRGLTLVEMLFLVALLAVVIAVLIPVMNYQREKSRAETCRMNLREIALAVNEYSQSWSYFPSGFNWSIFPGRKAEEASLGSGHGVLVAILPYMEQVAVFSCVNFNVNIHSMENRTVMGLKIRQYACPSDRSIGDLAKIPDETYVGGGGVSAGFHYMARSSYAAVAGPWVVNTWKLPGMGQNERSSFVEARASQLGVFNVHSQVARRDVTDGASNTILVGEHALEILPEGLRRDSYWWVSGNHGDTLMTTLFPPNAHKMKLNEEIVRNSASSMHPGLVNFAFADGSVRSVRDSVQSLPPLGRGPVRVGGGRVPHIQGWVAAGVSVDVVGPDPFWDTVFRLGEGERFGVYQALSTRAGGERAGPD